MDKSCEIIVDEKIFSATQDAQEKMDFDSGSDTEDEFLQSVVVTRDLLKEWFHAWMDIHANEIIVSAIHGRKIVQSKVTGDVKKNTSIKKGPPVAARKYF